MLQIGNDKGAPLSQVSGVSFWAKSSSSNSVNFEITMQGTGSHTVTIPTTWTHFQWPITDFNPPDPIKKFAVQPNANVDVYFDDITWVKSASSQGTCAPGVVHRGVGESSSMSAPPVHGSSLSSHAKGTGDSGSSEAGGTQTSGSKPPIKPPASDSKEDNLSGAPARQCLAMALATIFIAIML